MDLDTVAAGLSALAAVATVISVALLRRQLRDGTQTAFAELVLSLESEWRHVSSIFDTLHHLDGADSKVAKADVERYFSFFSNLAFLESKGNISFQVLDEMFHYRFFSMLGQPVCQEVLTAKREYRGRLESLKSKWETYCRSTNRTSIVLTRAVEFTFD